MPKYIQCKECKKFTFNLNKNYCEDQLCSDPTPKNQAALRDREKIVGGWNYADSDSPSGPVGKHEAAALLPSKKMHGETLVWTEGMDEWAPAKSMPFAAHLTANASPKTPLLQPANLETNMPALSKVEPVQSDAKENNPELLYPGTSVSPHVCWLNLIWPGIAQLVLGKTSVGFFFIIFYPILFLLFSFTEQFLFAFFTLILIGRSIIDAYIVGSRLKEGKPVKREGIMED